jgi:hypothetical protein
MSPTRPATVLFLMGNPEHTRNFEWVLRALDRSGHRVTVAFEGRKPADAGGLSLVARLSEELGSLSYELEPAPRREAGAGRLRLALRAIPDYLRYFEPGYEQAGDLRRRAAAFLPDRAEASAAAILRRGPKARRGLDRLARRAARSLGADPAIRRELERRRPSVLVAVPMLQFASRQSDWVLAGQELGIPTMSCAYGWDHFTNKGVMHARPDRVAVWNEAQRAEAVELHQLVPESIVVAGAWPYDHWFESKPSRSRAELCNELEIPPDRALILYACSSRFIGADERPAVVRWLRAVRASSDPRLARANVIVRPHHLNAAGWGARSHPDLPEALVFPAGGSDPVDGPSRADYFDTIAHADAVVGINTSALIESAIADTPALAYPAPEFRSRQEALPHFRRLVGEEGFVQASRSMPDHLEQLAAALAGRSDPSARRRFVATFLRPHGDEPTPSERVVAALEELLD